MTLITREGKGSKITMDEMDSNLNYLESLGVTNVTLQDDTITFERESGINLQVNTDNNLPITKTIIGSIETENDTVVYKGILNYKFDEPSNSIPLIYVDSSKVEIKDISVEYGKSYYISASIISFLSNELTTDQLYCGLFSNIDYGNPFITGTGFNNPVSSIVVKSDGKILVGGSFTSYNGVESNKIIQLNSDGSKDTSFVIGTGFNNEIRSIILQLDGKILVGGGFTSYNGVSSSYIIRLNSDGSKDTSFVIGTGFNNVVSSIVLQSDGKILVGGVFTSYNGVASNRIIRLNSDGSKDTSFVIGTGFNAGGVSSIVLQSDGKILLGGSFISYNVVASNRIIRLNSDGSKDTSFVIGTGFNTTVNSIVLQSDGKILLGGVFISYNGVASSRIIRLNSDGSKDTSFVIGTGFNTGGVYSIAVQTNGKILVGGSFTSYNGVESNKIIQLNSDGSKDTSFVIGTGFNTTVNSIVLQSDGKILLGGVFISYNGVASNRIIRLKSDGMIYNGESEFITSKNNSVNILNYNVGKLCINLQNLSNYGIINFELIVTSGIK
jgi:uncharacterized delta-60 repeat protein